MTTPLSWWGHTHDNSSVMVRTHSWQLLCHGEDTLMTTPLSWWGHTHDNSSVMVRTHSWQLLYFQDSWVSTMTRLWARWPAVHFLALTPIFSSPKIQTGYGAHTLPPMQLVLGDLFPAVGHKLTTQFHLVSWLRGSGAGPLLPIYATRHAQGH